MRHYARVWKPKGAITRRTDDYLKFESYVRRQSYAILSDRLKSQRIPHLLINCYFSLKGKKDSNEELSKFDYWLALTVNSLTWFPSFVKNNGLLNYLKLLAFNQSYEKKKINYFFSLPEKERRHHFNIANDVYWAGGTTKYLNLDKPKQVKKWVKKYAGLERHVLFDMLECQYNKLHPHPGHVKS